MEVSFEVMIWPSTLDSWGASIRQREQHSEAYRHKEPSVASAKHHLLIPLLEDESFGPIALHIGLSGAN